MKSSFDYRLLGKRGIMNVFDEVKMRKQCYACLGDEVASYQYEFNKIDKKVISIAFLLERIYTNRN